MEKKAIKALINYLIDKLSDATDEDINIEVEAFGANVVFEANNDTHMLVITKNSEGEDISITSMSVMVNEMPKEERDRLKENDVI